MSNYKCALVYNTFIGQNPFLVFALCVRALLEMLENTWE